MKMIASDGKANAQVDESLCVKVTLPVVAAI